MMPKKPASNSSTPSRMPRARTYSGASRSAAATDGSTSSRVKGVTDSTPPTRFFQNVSTSGAPGKRPAMPMMATGSAPPAPPAACWRFARRASTCCLSEGRDASPDSTAASCATVGDWKSWTMGISSPCSCRSRATHWSASSELPPSSKKLSWMPTRSMRSSRAHDSEMVRSSGERGAT
ncbi:hypothetical protein COSO111634_22075 [Corallococcus soli]